MRWLVTGRYGVMPGAAEPSAQGLKVLGALRLPRPWMRSVGGQCLLAPLMNGVGVGGGLALPSLPDTC